jgi:hypothetical protein
VVADQRLKDGFWLAMNHMNPARAPALSLINGWQ